MCQVLAMGKVKRCCCSVCWLSSVTICSYLTAALLIAGAVVLRLVLPGVLEDQVAQVKCMHNVMDTPVMVSSKES